MLARGTTYRSQRFDGYGGRWTNERIGLGSEAARASSTEFLEPDPLDRRTVAALLRYNGLARRLALREPYDATREGVELGETPEAEALEKWARVHALPTLRRGRGWARAFGGSAIVVLVDDGRPWSEPIDWANIRAIRGVRVLTRHECVPVRYDYGRTSYSIGEVLEWQATIGHASVRLHADRVIVMQGEDLPDEELLRNQGWGGSVFDLAFAELRNLQASHDLVPEFIATITQAVFKQQGLAAGAAAGKEDAIAARYAALVGGMSVLHAVAIDADKEDYSILQRPAAGLGETFEILIRALVAAGDMPRVILLGETPGGLHAGSDAPEVRAWYDHVASMQRDHYTAPLERLLSLAEASRTGPTGGRAIEREIEWRPLYQLTAGERADLELKRAQRRSVDVQSSVVTPVQAAQDPDVRELYNLGEAELLGGDGPALLAEEVPLADEEELLPVVPADLSRIPDGETLISAQDAGARLGCSPGVIHRLAAAGAFPAWRIGARWRYAWSAIARHAEGGARVH